MTFELYYWIDKNKQNVSSETIIVCTVYSKLKSTNTTVSIVIDLFL